LDDNLDFYPVTRRAWNEALKANRDYQEDLRQQIK